MQSFGDTLWADLQLKRLSAHVEEVDAKLSGSQGVRDLPPFQAFEETIFAFRDSIPLLAVLKGEALRKRHWDALGEITGMPVDTESNAFTLAKIFAMQLHKHAADVSDLCKAAAKELVIECAIKALAEAWKDTKFELAKYNKGGEDRGMVLRGTEEVTVALEDAALNLQSMLASRFVKPFADDVRGWESKLSHVGETIDAWMGVQRKWMYLESIFVGSDDIRQQLPEEAKRFDGVDKAWRKIMADTARNPNVVDACTAEGRLEALNALAEQLETCQKSLSEYLDTKRNAFPRYAMPVSPEFSFVLRSTPRQRAQACFRCRLASGYQE